MYYVLHKTQVKKAKKIKKKRKKCQNVLKQMPTEFLLMIISE